MPGDALAVPGAKDKVGLLCVRHTDNMFSIWLSVIFTQYPSINYTVCYTYISGP